MSLRYQPVGWNRNKLVYDAVLLGGVALYILTFLRIAPMFQAVSQPLDDAILRMRAFGSCAFLMLSFILCIGPLARLDRRFLPLLYNRRHFGVLTATVAGAHLNYVLGWYFAFSPTDPWVALLSSNTSFGRLPGFPFELFGLAAFIVLLLLAATSHDFWLAFLTPPVWKALHMAVYGAYGAIVLHVALGPLQAAANPALAVTVVASVFVVVGLHLAAGLKERDVATATQAGDAGWVDAGTVEDLGEGRGRVVALRDDERVAIFRHGGRLSAIANACAHQNGPLGEGRIIDGCVTCPWHGFQYRPEDGCAPPPFTEKLATYRLKLDGARILLDPRANPPGTYVEPISIAGQVS
jgi:nitrite reductase/ring-hydroxylating ferredoxin subunit/DMSO/TMAO reductase YedYZ heme-binding membrane subunit